MIETGDIFRGAYLLCQGGRIGKTRLAGEGQVVFVIEGKRVYEEDMKYRTGNALVNPLKLKETLNLLRDILFKIIRDNKRDKERRTRYDDHKRGDRGRQAV